MTRLKQRPRRPAAAQRSRLAAAAPTATRQTPTEWYRLGPVMEVVGDQADPQATASSADVYVYDVIGGWWGMTAEDFVTDVAALEVDELHVHLNSPGGDAFEGITIANVLREHPARVVVWVDGLAASAASVIAMAGDEVVMNLGAQLMIHDAATWATGDAADLRKAAEMLDSLSDAVAAAYADRAGGTAAEWRAIMQSERWYTGEAAVAAGLADRVATAADTRTADGEQVVPGTSAGSLWDWWDSAGAPAQHAALVRELYAHPPAELAGPRTPAASAGGSTSTQEGATMPNLIEGLRQRLGLPDDATDDDVLDAVDERLPDADEVEATPGKEVVVEPGTDPEPDAAPTNRSVETVDSATLAELRRGAEDGRAARAKQVEDERNALLSAAVSDGRIPPARRDHWAAALKADPEGARQSLAGLAKGLIPVDGERGHDRAGAAETAATDLAAVRETPAFKNWKR